MLFFFNATATAEIYTLSLHDALPICARAGQCSRRAVLAQGSARAGQCSCRECSCRECSRSEEHTSELQSLAYLVCRLLLEKKNHEPLWANSPVVSPVLLEAELAGAGG